MKQATALSLLDAHDACVEIEKITTLGNFPAYLGDWHFRLIVERLMEIVGEAMNRATKSEPDIVEYIPDARAIIGMRNRISHGYDQIDNETVWQTAVTEVSALRIGIEQQLRDGGYWPSDRP